MEKTMPLGITIIYFNDQSKNIYAKLPSDRERRPHIAVFTLKVLQCYGVD